MRADLTVHEHDRASYEAYVYGSAEVVGLMCVRAFLNEDRRPDEPVREPDETQVAGARALGAAFQKINFLRDLGADTEELGRTYFPGTTPGHLDAAQLHAILDGDQRRRGRRAGGRARRLPRRARYAVGATLALYQRLLDEIATRPPESLLVGRVRLPTPGQAAGGRRVRAGGGAGGSRGRRMSPRDPAGSSSSAAASRA